LPDPADSKDPDAFRARLEAAKAKHLPEPRDVAVSALAQGTRYALEIAATTIVGAGIGWMLDRWLQTRPWLFLLFLLLGIAAGFWNLMKAVNMEAAAARKRAAEYDAATRKRAAEYDAATRKRAADRMDDQV
jgi:ATP synthase protein I